MTPPACLLALVATALLARPLPDPDILEPSVRHEVDHALSLAPTNPPAATALPFATNGLDRTALAIRLVSTQRADGRWLCGTNDVTAAAIGLLKGL